MAKAPYHRASIPAEVWTLEKRMACGGAEVLGNYSSATKAASGAYRYLQRTIGRVLGRPAAWTPVAPDADALTITRDGHEWQFQRTRWLVDGDGT